MSDTLAALLIIPTLAVLVLVLECSRVGCTSMWRMWKQGRADDPSSADGTAFEQSPDLG